MQDGDAVVLFNFRADRMVEISKAFEYEEFNAFDRKRFPKVSMLLALPFRTLQPVLTRSRLKHETKLLMLAFNQSNTQCHTI